MMPHLSMAGDSRTLRALVVLLALVPAACRGGGPETMKRSGPQGDTRPYLLETVGEFAVARLYADGFDELSPRERALAFNLSRAALAGRDIYYDQMGRDNLEIRNLLEEILTHSRSLPKETVDPLLTYLKLFWINNGNHNDRTKRKFVPGFSFGQLQQAARVAARDGADIRLALGETLEQKLERLRRAIFDADYEPLVTCKSPPPGQDILTCSAVNYYEGVTLADLRGFHETHPLNSRLVRRNGRLIEEIYRAGRDGVPPGRYAPELQTIIGFLERAEPLAEPPQRAVLGHLTDYFETGDPADFRAYNIAWVQDDPPVDTINGFIESYKDPRSQKGAYEGMVFFVDRRQTRMQKDLAAQAQYFEDRAPWAEAYKRKGFTVPVANAINVLIAVGDGGPMPPVGINLPNEESIRERYGNKSVSLINVMEAGKRATHGRMVDEFVWPDDRDLLRQYGAEVDLLQTTMHEVLGHASGRVSPSLQGDPSGHLREYYAALEEARAELVALYNFFDPKLLQIGALSSPRAAEAAYQDFVVGDLYMLRRVRQGDVLEDDHMRADHLIVSYLRQVGGALEELHRDGKTYLRVRDMQAMRHGVADLLAEIQRIKAEGDYTAGRALVERFGIRIDPKLRDEVVARAEAAGIPSYVAFVMPDLEPIRDAAGNVVDARVSFTSDLTTQMLEYSGRLPLEQDARPSASTDRPAGGP